MIRSRIRLFGVLSVVVLCGAVLVGCSDSEVSKDDDTESNYLDDSKCYPPEDLDVVATPVVGSESDLDLTTFDGVSIRVHWFPVDGASESDPAPTALMGPGWSRPGDTDVDAVGLLGAISIASLHDAGYNVLTWDPRGFGESGGTAEVDSAEFEGRDVQTILNWVSAQPEVDLDAEGDPSVGMVGASYGGGIQLVTAAIDCRVDAIVPVTAWNSLRSSLYRAETVKIGWAGLLHSASASASVDPHVDHAFETGLATGQLDEEDQEWFAARGPGDLVAQIAVPTLLVQGTVDTLFSLDEALTNHGVLVSSDVTTALLLTCSGHGVCLTEAGDPDIVTKRAISWLDRHVRGDESVDTGPVIDVIDQNGARYHGSELPTPSGSPLSGSGSGTLELLPTGGSGPVVVPPEKATLLSGLAQTITPAPAANAVEVDIAAPTDDALVFGAPMLTLTYSGQVEPGERPMRVFAQLVDGHTGLVVGNQITPIEVVLDGETHTTTVPLESIVFAADPDSSIMLQVVASTVAYASPRLGGSVDFESIEVTLPVVDSLEPAG